MFTLIPEGQRPMPHDPCVLPRFCTAHFLHVLSYFGEGKQAVGFSFPLVPHPVMPRLIDSGLGGA